MGTAGGVTGWIRGEAGKECGEGGKKGVCGRGV